MNFALGEVVRLKSGGPPMTVDQSVDGQVLCSWFVGAERKVARFSAASLEPHRDPPQRTDNDDDYNPVWGGNGRNRTTGY